MNRRGFLLGMAGILATATAPAIVRAASIMPVRAPLPEVFGNNWVISDGSALLQADGDMSSKMLMDFALKLDRQTDQWRAQFVGWHPADEDARIVVREVLR